MKERKRGLRLAAALAGILAAAAGIDAQQAPVFKIDFTNAQLMPSHWQIQLNPDGTGQFDADGLGSGAGGSKQIEAGDVHRPIQLSPAFTEQVFATARRRKLFAISCDSRLKVAFQGTKRLSYSGPEGSGECEFNYSKDKEIQSLGDSLMAVETTLLFGARLEKLLVHDRLGIDKEMENLVSASKEGSALEMGSIRETLVKIASDDQVLERARKKARLLLTQTN
jgi:hypothetical protein